MKSLPFVLGNLVLVAAPVFAHAQTEEKVTNESLPKLLIGLGYEPTKVGETIQRVAIERDKFTFRLNFSVSGNTKKVWMSTYLVEFADLSKILAKPLADALLTNGEIGPAHFYLAKVG